MAKLLAADEEFPEDDRRAAYEHLAEHYRELAEEPPAFDKVPTPERFAGVALPAGGERVVALGFTADKFADLAKADRWRSDRGFPPPKGSKASDQMGLGSHVLSFDGEAPPADQCRTLELAAGVMAVLTSASKQEPPVANAKKGEEPEPKKNEPAAPAETETAAEEVSEVPAELIADMESELASDGPVDRDRAKRVFNQMQQVVGASEPEE